MCVCVGRGGRGLCGGVAMLCVYWVAHVTDNY